ncbi:fimbria/pilus periplasmic chaperone [Escherichia coli]|nr:fimbria/pilus periplasmic chaperone [Escherichia coli]
MNQTVELGQVRSSRLAKAGDLSSAVGFNIKLNDCDTNVSSNAAVAFLGTTVTSNDDTLALQSSAAGSAQNVGIEKDTQFVITPPLFSMQGKKENTLRIINATNHQLPGDRESLFWVNVKAIPAMEKDQKNENTLQLAIISRIKMFYRPTNLAMAPEEAPAMLRFRRSGSKLTLINPTPYFITVTNMKAGNSNLPNTMVPPKGEVSVDITHAATGDISFQTINDYGALTPRIKATMQ